MVGFATRNYPGDENVSDTGDEGVISQLQTTAMSARAQESLHNRPLVLPGSCTPRSIA